MYLIREVFDCKPGKAKELVKIFKQALPLMEKDGIINGKIMTDATGNYWTVVVQFEIQELGDFFKNLRSETSDPAMKEIFGNYISTLEGGRREIFILE